MRQRLLVALLASALFSGSGVAAPAGALDDDDDGGGGGVRPAAACSRFDVPVSIDGAGPVTIHGLHCARPTRLRDTVQVLMAGATEGGLSYWDFPHPDFYAGSGGALTKAGYRRMHERYSYAGHLARLGYASVVIDRIGTGRSGRPASREVTIESNAQMLHEIVTQLRDGSLGSYRRVIAVGRSLSGPVAFVEAARFRDVDGMIVQSFRHHQEPPFAQFASTLVPAQTAAHLAHVPPGYLTTRAGTRKDFFFTSAADAAVVAHEEATRDTITDGEVATFVPSFDVSRQIDPAIPVLSIVGELDSLFCTPGCPRATEEVASFPNAACFESVVVAGTGHNMNLEPAASRAFDAMVSWVETNFGRGGRPCVSPH